MANEPSDWLYSHRVVPSSEERSDRTRRLVINARPRQVENIGPSFEPGNTKIGSRGGSYRTVLVWNIPALRTCPGSSAWCRANCYTAAERPEIYHRDLWWANYVSVTQNPHLLRSILAEQLREAEGPVAVRIHSSGDFFSESYIELWDSLIAEYKDIAFWAYTRSWVKPNLMKALQKLKSHSNVQVFASWDRTMPPPPSDWRVSYTIDPEDAESKRTTLLAESFSLLKCPEEEGRIANCATCGYCLNAGAGGVAFRVH